MEWKMENSWVSKRVRSAWEGSKLSNHSPRGPAVYAASH